MVIKAVFFDFMGTCLDWHSTIVSALPPSLPEPVRSAFALEWRQAYFDANAARVQRHLPPRDIDLMHRETLTDLLSRPEHAAIHAAFAAAGPASSDAVIAAWHRQSAWPDVAPALRALRDDLGLETYVSANGTTRLQLDLVQHNARASGTGPLPFDLLFSSELVGAIKPAAAAYTRALELTRLQPDEVVMVAAHAYDTRGAKKVGMRTVYVYRWTDDVREDQEVVRREHDAYLEAGMEGLVEVVRGWMREEEQKVEEEGL